MKNLLNFYISEAIVIIPIIVLVALIFFRDAAIKFITSNNYRLEDLFVLSIYVIIILPIIIWAHTGILNLYEKRNGCSF